MKQKTKLISAIILAGITMSTTSIAQVFGSGSTNFIAKWDNAAGTTIGNSSIFDNGLGVGINTTVPGSYWLNVNGSTFTQLLTVNGTSSLGTVNSTGVIKANFGFNANNAGIINAGAISGITSISSSGAISGTTITGSGAITGTSITASTLDFNTTLGTKGYKIGGNYMLYNNNNTADLFAGYNCGNSSMTGHSNILVGSGCGPSIFSGSDNTLMGYNAGNAEVSGVDNTLIGWQAGVINTDSYNTLIGYAAGNNSTGALMNSALGFKAGYNITTGDGNTCLGIQSGYNIAAGNYNTCVGYNTGNTGTNTTWSYNTFLGYSANANGVGYTNSTAVGNGALSVESNDVVLGNSSVGFLRCQQSSISALSDRRVKNNIQSNVPGLEFINLLKPVTYHFDIHKQDQIMGIKSSVDSTGKQIPEAAGKYDIEQRQYTGFIAQQVDSAAQKVKYDFSGVDKPSITNPLYGLRYSDFVVPMVKAIQELSRKQDSLVAVIATLKGETARANMPSTDIELASKSAIIYQNMPNPFGDGTVVKYFIPENANGASVTFFDEFGNEIKTVELVNKGVTSELNLSTMNLAAGVYSYSLMINGRVVDTKKMIKAH